MLDGLDVLDVLDGLAVTCWSLSQSWVELVVNSTPVLKRLIYLATLIYPETGAGQGQSLVPKKHWKLGPTSRGCTVPTCV